MFSSSVTPSNQITKLIKKLFLKQRITQSFVVPFTTETCSIERSLRFAAERDSPVIFVSMCGKYLQIASYRPISELLVEESFLKIMLCINFKCRKHLLSCYLHYLCTLWNKCQPDTSQIVCYWFSYYFTDVPKVFTPASQKISKDESRFHSVASLFWQVWRKLSGLITCFPSVSSSLLIGAWRKIAVISHSTGSWKFICQEKMDMEITDFLSTKDIPVLPCWG